MKCPICETEGCKKDEREAKNKLSKYECVKCETFYIEKILDALLENDFIQVIKTNTGKDIKLNNEIVNSYRDTISEYIDTHTNIHITFKTDNIRDNQISIKKLIKIVHLMVSANDNNGIFETEYRNDKGLYDLFYDSENKFAWAVYLPVLSQTGVEQGSFENIYSKEEAFKKLKEMVDKKD